MIPDYGEWFERAEPMQACEFIRVAARYLDKERTDINENKREDSRGIEKLSKSISDFVWLKLRR
jgi:hypothetical protein